MANADKAHNPRVRKPLTQERLKELMHYDPETGVFVWSSMAVKKVQGKIAGCVWENKIRRLRYIQIRIDRNLYYAHKLVYLYVYGFMPKIIDHVDCDGSNNRLNNLRSATHVQNNANARLNSRNTSGIKGVSWCEDRGRWEAKIQHNSNLIHLGRFVYLEDARNAYEKASLKYNGEFSRFQ